MKSRLAAGLAALLLSAAPAFAQTQLKVDTSAPIGTIQPEVYGQFLEHVGLLPYDGIWVGPDSEIPNTDGIRDDVFNALKALDVPVIRWPGGCYADLYHWRDGIGPPEERPMRTNMVWGGTPEPNSFGTQEFFNFAERLGAKTYLNLNLGTGTVKEAADWLEYLTATKGDRAEERRANGREAPWKVDYIAIGNETWGCGGHQTATTYADQYALFASFAMTEGDQPVRIISGSHDGNPEYSDTVLSHPYIADLAEGISMHFYTLPTGDWDRKGAATGFPETEWISTMARTLRMDEIITGQEAMFAAHPDLKPDFGLYVDEWGMWVDKDSPDDPSLLQQNTIRDAVVAGLNLNIFHAHADSVKMTNIAQMVNVLQAMILTDGPDMVLTPTYHVFEMYKPFMSAEALPVSLEDGPAYTLGETSVPALSASAARTPDGRLMLALVNADARESHEVDASAFGATEAKGRMLSGKTMDAHNDFDAPDTVHPVAIKARAGKRGLILTLPARSVTVVELTD